MIQNRSVESFISEMHRLEKKTDTLDQKLAHTYPFYPLLKKIWDSETKELSQLARASISLFDRIEKIPTKFSSNKEINALQNETFSILLKTAAKINNVLSHSDSSKIRMEQQKLMQRVAALKYRIEEVNGGKNSVALDQKLCNKLYLAAIEWKKNYALMKKKHLTIEDLKKLQDASNYPEFAHLLLASPQLRESFFNWSLRDNNGVAQFVQFPATSARIKSAFIAARVGRLGSDLFCIEKKKKSDQELEKVITLPFYVKNKIEHLNVLDEQQEVEFCSGLKMTIKQALEIFSKKNRDVGNLEFFQSRGITNWNCHQLGSWNPLKKSYDLIDLTKFEWWKDLPVLEEISHQQFEDRLNQALKSLNEKSKIKIEKGEWVVSVKSARTTPDMDLDGRHGYLEIAIPTEKGTYALYPFGNFASIFPDSSLELIQFIANTVRGKAAFPDENFFYSHREHATCPIKLKPEEGIKLMQLMQKELMKSRSGDLIFQFGGENCAFWAQKLLHNLNPRLPNFFKIDFVESTPLNPVLGTLFAFFRSLPKKIRPYAISCVDTLLGSSRKIKVFENSQTVYKSHKTSPVRNEYVIYQPGYLHYQIENNLIEGYTSVGHS